MKIIYTYYAFNTSLDRNGEYSVSDFVSDPVDLPLEKQNVLEVYFACSVMNNWAIRQWNKRLTDTYVKNNLDKCAEFIIDEYGKQGTYPEDYDYDYFREEVMSLLPNSFWDYARVSKYNPRGYTDDIGVISYKIINE